MRIRAIFFDFDGVIVDSNSVKAEGFRQLFSDAPASLREDILRHHLLHGGISRIEKIQYAYSEILKQPLSQFQLDQLAQRYAELVVEKVVAAPWLPGAMELLEQITKEMMLFLISGTPQEELRSIVARKGIMHFFREILGSPVKKPLHIQQMLKQFSLNPQECVFVGDALTDYNAAAETNMHFIGIKGQVEFPEACVVCDDCYGVARQLGISKLV